MRTRLDEATRIRLQSEVPMGALLSGGVDSSAVVAAMVANTSGSVRTFSAGFDEADHDERRFARLVASRLGTEHHELRVAPDALAIMPRLARHYGEPFGDSSAVPTFLLAELVAREVMVVLTGDGGDESFGGYERYVPSRRLSRIERLPAAPAKLLAHALRLLGEGGGARSLRRRLQRAARLAAMDSASLYAQSLLVFDAPARQALLVAGFVADGQREAPERLLVDAWASIASDERVERMMGVDVATYLPGDLLVKLDIATMAHSVEARSPFLDHELMEFAASLPAELKLDAASGKALLRSALRGVLPDEVLDRPKMGFAVPLGRWLRADLAGLAGTLLLDPGAKTRAYLRPKQLEELLREQRAGVADHGMRIWALMMLESWHREVLSPSVLSRNAPAADVRTTPPTAATCAESARTRDTDARGPAPGAPGDTRRRG